MQHETKAHMKHLLFIPIILAFIACQKSAPTTEQPVASTQSTEQAANKLLTEAQTMLNNGQWQQARLIIDSLHKTYPKNVNQRRIANTIKDSITCLEAQQTIAYVDSVLPSLEKQVDALIKRFKYEKNEKYEDHGKYVHRLLVTNTNTSRNFIQAYILDNKKTIVKSYYYGNYKVNQQTLNIKSDEQEQTFSGSNHHFQDGAHHEIMTLSEEDALELLKFVSSHQKSRVRVEGIGDKPTRNWVYYLNDKEKEALSDTYQLGWLMKDINKLENMKNSAYMQINYFNR